MAQLEAERQVVVPMAAEVAQVEVVQPEVTVTAAPRVAAQKAATWLEVAQPETTPTAAQQAAPWLAQRVEEGLMVADRFVVVTSKGGLPSIAGDPLEVPRRVEEGQLVMDPVLASQQEEGLLALDPLAARRVEVGPPAVDYLVAARQEEGLLEVVLVLVAQAGPG